jgi:hypothetical protein
VVIHGAATAGATGPLVPTQAQGSESPIGSPEYPIGKVPVGTTTQRPALQDISPDLGTTVRAISSSTAGLTQRFYITPASKLAISLNAGVWRAIGDGPWQQLSQSRVDSFCLAVDPANALHLLLGTRDGSAVPIELNDGGMWESTDGGDNWSYSLNPLMFMGPGQPRSQFVPDIHYSPSGKLLIATAYGIITRDAPRQYRQLLRTTSRVTAITVVERPRARKSGPARSTGLGADA